MSDEVNKELNGRAVPEGSEETAGESMADYAVELEASLKKIKSGDILTGTVIGVLDDRVIVDLKYYAEGIIRKEDLSGDPDFVIKDEIHEGEEITATVLKMDDGEGNLLLSRKAADDVLVWERLSKMMEDRTVVTVKIADIVKGGAVAWLEGVRGFIPASKLAAGYVENLDEWKGRSVEVTVITVETDKKRLVLSGREVAREKMADEKNKKISKCQTGAVMAGTVETLQPYGAFVRLENGLSGLIHISQISRQRIKHPSAVLKEGQTVTVKIISTANNKISLSMRELEAGDEDIETGVEYHESAGVTTGLGDLLKGLKLQ